MAGKRRYWCLTAALAAAVALASCTTAAGPTTPGPAKHQGSNPIVATSDGRLRGQAAGTIDEFLGIPYAAPPVGPLRWRPPQPAAHWTGVRSATRFGPHCPQTGSPFGLASMSENCLFLNVYAPGGSLRGGSLPVMVWIHGGDLTAGESNDYNPAGLVRDGVVVVTINYRLGALGFLADQALRSPNGSSGDYGLMDQEAALRWVQQNIRRFGGNPRNVTIFGESAGGLSVLAQLVSPAARGLFAKAIIESGSYSLLQPSLTTAEASGEAFAAKAGCASQTAASQTAASQTAASQTAASQTAASQTAACLRRLPVQTILNDQGTVGPDIDGTVLTQSIGTALASGDFSHVPVIDGTNHDEWRLFIALFRPLTGPVTAANYQRMIASTASVSSAEAAVVAAHYPLNSFASPAEALGTVGTDAIFACPALTMDRELSKFTPTFGYEFNDENAPELFLAPISGFAYGAAHGSELQYLFHLNESEFPRALTSEQQRLSATMQRYWTNFARSGSPSGPGAPVWPRFGAGQRMISLVPPAPRVETGFAAEHQCAFWAAAGSP